MLPTVRSFWLRSSNQTACGHRIDTLNSLVLQGKIYLPILSPYPIPPCFARTYQQTFRPDCFSPASSHRPFPHPHTISSLDMPLPLPPPTPFFPSRFADESLLLATEPFYGDVTLGDDLDWPSTGSVPSLDSQLPLTGGRNKTLDLDAYLPDSDGSHSGEVEGEETSSLEGIDGRNSTRSTGQHKREGSESLIAQREAEDPKRREDFCR